MFEEEEEDWEEGCESSKPRKAKPVALDRDGKLDAEIEQMRTGQDDTSNKRPAVERSELLSTSQCMSAWLWQWRAVGLGEQEG